MDEEMREMGNVVAYTLLPPSKQLAGRTWTHSILAERATQGGQPMDEGKKRCMQHERIQR